MLRPPKPGSLLVIVLSCTLIGSLSSSTAGQLEGSSKQLQGFGVPGFVLLKFCYLYFITPFWMRYFLANEMSFCAVCTYYNFILVTNRVVGLMPGESLGWEVLIKLCQQKIQSNFFTICHLKYFFQEFPIGETRMIYVEVDELQKYVVCIGPSISFYYSFF